MNRAVSTELELDAGCYTVRMKITATRYQNRPSVEEVIRMNCKNRQEKLLQIGMSYDLAHAKGIIQETEEEKKHKAEKEARNETAAKAKAREEAKKRKYKDWLIKKKRIERSRREKERHDAHKRKKEERKSNSVGLGEQEEEEEEEEARSATPNGTANQEDPKENKGNERLAGQRPLGDKANVEANFPDSKDIVLSPSEPSRETLYRGLIDSASPSNPQDMASSTATTSVGAPVDKNIGQAEDSGTADLTPRAGSFSKAQKSADRTIKDRIAKTEVYTDDQAEGASPPTVKVNGEDVGSRVLQTPPPSPGSLRPSSVMSEAETVVTYVSSIDTDLDGRFFEDDFHDDDYRDGSSLIAEGGPGNDDEELEEYLRDPWNAVCIVGLRLYTREGEACVKVVRPPEDEDEEQKEETPLDVDDPMRSMSDEPVTPSTPLKEKKGPMPESIAERLARQVPVPKSVMRK